MAPPMTAKRPGAKHVEVVRAMFPYTAQRPDELTFAEGDVLYVISKENQDWFLCKVGETEGLVPSNYVGENTATIDNPMHEAAKRGNINFVNELLNQKVSPNKLDKAGNSPLHWACRSGHLEIVKLLLSEKSVINIQNKMGDTPLHMAAWGGHKNVVQLLLQQEGVDPKARNNDGDTPNDIAKGDSTAALLITSLGVSGSAANLVGSDSEEDE